MLKFVSQAPWEFANQYTVPLRLDFILDLFQCGMRFCWKVLMQNKGITLTINDVF